MYNPTSPLFFYILFQLLPSRRFWSIVVFGRLTFTQPHEVSTKTMLSYGHSSSCMSFYCLQPIVILHKRISDPQVGLELNIKIMNCHFLGFKKYLFNDFSGQLLAELTLSYSLIYRQTSDQYCRVPELFGAYHDVIPLMTYFCRSGLISFSWLIYNIIEVQPSPLLVHASDILFRIIELVISWGTGMKTSSLYNQTCCQSLTSCQKISKLSDSANTCQCPQSNYFQ